ncbi:MAG: hypothetical protein ACLFQ7_11690 [Phormidium sp.]
MSRLTKPLTFMKTLDQCRHWRYPLSLLLLGTVLATGAIAAQVFGTSGRDGMRGRDGRSGERGPDQMLVVDGRGRSLQLMGTSGRDGEDGRRGEDAYNCSQPSRPSDHLRGADGGDGGSGGDGGDGGDGGNLTLYYSQLDELREIYVDARGGEGGYGGYGGYGGRGCSCRRGSWTVDNERYYCTSGHSGRRGGNGRAGNEGDPGQLRIVAGTTPLEPEQPSVELPLSLLIDRPIDGPVDLSKNVWLRRRGARSLLGSGSVIADEYEEFVERLERAVALAWNSDRRPSDFADLEVRVSLHDDGSVVMTFPEELWIQGSWQEEGPVSTYSVDYSLRRSEATELAIADANRNPREFNIAVVDTAQQSEVLETEFAVKIRSTRSRAGFRHVRDYQTRYEGELPAHLVSRDYNRFVLDLSRLPLEARDLTSRSQVEVELIVTRRLGDYEAQQTLLWQGQLD